MNSLVGKSAFGCGILLIALSFAHLRGEHATSNRKPASTEPEALQGLLDLSRALHEEFGVELGTPRERATLSAEGESINPRCELTGNAAVSQIFDAYAQGGEQNLPEIASIDSPTLLPADSPTHQLLGVMSKEHEGLGLKLILPRREQKIPALAARYRLKF